MKGIEKKNMGHTRERGTNKLIEQLAPCQNKAGRHRILFLFLSFDTLLALRHGSPLRAMTISLSQARGHHARPLSREGTGGGLSLSFYKGRGGGEREKQKQGGEEEREREREREKGEGRRGKRKKEKGRREQEEGKKEVDSK